MILPIGQSFDRCFHLLLINHANVGKNANPSIASPSRMSTQIVADPCPVTAFREIYGTEGIGRHDKESDVIVRNAGRSSAGSDDCLSRRRPRSSSPLAPANLPNAHAVAVRRHSLHYFPCISFFCSKYGLLLGCSELWKDVLVCASDSHKKGHGLTLPGGPDSQ